jgi:flagellar hook-basal body complex protein FliE
MNEIRIGPPPLPAPLSTESPRAAGKSFGDTLQKAVMEVNRLQAEADRAAEGLVTGREPNLHRTIVALEKADISFKLMMKVRDKIIDAYREVMRMSV